MACKIWADDCEKAECVKQWGWKQAGNARSQLRSLRLAWELWYMWWKRPGPVGKFCLKTSLLPWNHQPSSLYCWHFLAQRFDLSVAKDNVRKNILQFMLFLCIRSKWLLGKGETVFPQSLRKGNTAEWPWVMLCSLAVWSLSSNPPGVTLECLKLLNGFLNGPFPRHKEGWGDKSDLGSDLVKPGVARKGIAVDQRHHCKNKGHPVCHLNFSDLRLCDVSKVLSFVFKSTGEMCNIKGTIMEPPKSPVFVVVYTEVLCYAIGKVIFSSKWDKISHSGFHKIDVKS